MNRIEIEREGPSLSELDQNMKYRNAEDCHYGFLYRNWKEQRDRYERKKKNERRCVIQRI